MTNPDSIRESWKDPKTAKARATRHGVRVKGKEYRSVRQAFRVLGLPDGEHIRFRLRLKKHKTLNEYGMTWFLIPLPDECRKRGDEFLKNNR